MQSHYYVGGNVLCTPTNSLLRMNEEDISSILLMVASWGVS